MALALMVLVTLTIVGLTAMNDTVLESTIARNHALYRNDLYLAEGAVRQAVQIMEDFANDNSVTDELRSGSWVQPTTFNIGEADFGDFRGDGGAVDFGDFIAANIPNAGFLVQFDKVIGSLDMTEPTTLYQFFVFGRGVGPMRNDPTEAVVKVAYRIRY